MNMHDAICRRGRRLRAIIIGSRRVVLLVARIVVDNPTKPLQR